MILAGHRTLDMMLASSRGLAAMAHKAENDGDDITLVGLMEEVEAREVDYPGFTEVFRRAYVRLIPIYRPSHQASGERNVP